MAFEANYRQFLERRAVNRRKCVPISNFFLGCTAKDFGVARACYSLGPVNPASLRNEKAAWPRFLHEILRSSFFRGEGIRSDLFLKSRILLSPVPKRQISSSEFLFIALFLFAATCNSGLAEESHWLTAEQMQREIQKPTVALTWSGRPLRTALQNLSTRQRVAIWLDRRIDPTLEPEVSFETTALQQILYEVANPLGAELGFVGPVVYIGPVATATKLWTILELRREDARRLPANVRNVWSTPEPAQWSDLTTPRELLQAVAQETGCQLEGLDAIPHDLWASTSLPPLTVVERLTLILAGFDRTFQFEQDGKLIRIIPMPDRPVLQREYSPKGDLARFTSSLESRIPNARIERRGAKVSITGTAEDHDAVHRQLRGEPERRTPTGPSEIRYTIKVENQQIGVVLRTLNVKAQLQVNVETEVQAKLYDRVTFEVKDATLEQLLQAAFRGTGLAFELKGQQLRVMPGKQ